MGVFTLANPSNINKLGLLRNLESSLLSSTILVLGDSTGYDSDSWPRLLADDLKTRYPYYTVDYKLWNITNNRYEHQTRLQTGNSSDGAAHILTGAAATSWRIEIPDSATTSPAGDIDVRVKIDFNGSAVSTSTELAAKYGAIGNRSWQFVLTNSNGLNLQWFTDGVTSVIALSTVTLSGAFLTSGPLWLRATLDVDNGAVGNSVKFYTSYDGSTWTQLGATVTAVGVTSIFNSTQSTQFIGRAGVSMTQQDHNFSFYEFELYGSLDETNILIDLDVANCPLRSAGGQTQGTFIDDAGNSATAYFNDNGSLLGSPRLLFLNGSASGRTALYSYDANVYPFQAVNMPNLCFINYGHNSGNDITFRADLKTLTDLLLVTNPDIKIVLIAQNKRVSGVASNVEEHRFRSQQVIDFAESQNFGLIDLYKNIPIDYINTDGIHPNANGKALSFVYVKKYMGLI